MAKTLLSIWMEKRPGQSRYRLTVGFPVCFDSEFDPESQGPGGDLSSGMAVGSGLCHRAHLDAAVDLASGK